MNTHIQVRVRPTTVAADARASVDARAVRLVIALGLAIAFQLLSAVEAPAAWPVAGGDVSLGFGATYRSADATQASTHRGTDIAAAAGSSVRAPLAGTVSFAGRVPGPGGSSVLAVTIQTSRGALTLMPLESATVAKGAEVAEGEEVGKLAEQGDPSTAGSHVHVGARRGDLYVDPLGWFERSAPPAQAKPDARQAGASASARVRAAAAGAGAPADIHAVAPSAAPIAAGTVAAAVPGARLAAGVTVAGAAPSPTGAVAPGVAFAAPAHAALGAPAQARPASTPSAYVESLVSRAFEFAARAARVWLIGFVGVLLALGALWPLWRGGAEKGPVEIAVRPVGDDVAAVAGR